MEINFFYNKLQSYLDNFSAYGAEFNINMKGIDFDHICYKCRSQKEYEYLRGLMEIEGKFIYQAIISGRRISIIGFKKPLVSKFGKVKYLELSDKELGSDIIYGCNHLELIPKSISYGEMVKRFKKSNSSLVRNKKKHHFTYDLVISKSLKIKFSKGRVIDHIYKSEMKK